MAGASRAVEVELHRLDGAVEKGELEAIDPNEVQLHNSAAVSLDQVLWVAFPGRQAGSDPPTARVALRGGGLLLARDVVTDERFATVTLGPDRVVAVPLAYVAGVLLGTAETAAVERWLQSARVDRQTDLLVAIRGTQRAELEGVVGPLTSDKLAFELDGEPVSVRRDRVFAFFLGTTAPSTPSLAEIHDVAGNVWPAQTVQWKDGRLTSTAPAYGEVSLPAEELLRIDFSKRRVAFLSDLPPAVVEHVPFFDVAYDVRKDASFGGGPIRIAGISFAKGLVMHSKTSVTYDVGKEYRRFACTVGMESAAGEHGDAEVQILGDGKVLWEGRVRGGEPGVGIDAALDGVERLVLIVDYGALADIGDHVAFGDARLIK